ncbi:MltA domain-containing protein [Alphaproteobacteria bacterium KMM 3653]|uniref:peptidoglycan lytic exotransglycosylase n=1 Tax=Harenicola maris TaxID=2841044 RepID=A0AAP2G8N9_9RHOB|nr:MltA domain-containing protein [Harenicola maris]
MIDALRALALGGLLAMAGAAGAGEPEISVLRFDQLNGWDEDDHEAALKVFQNTCADFDDPEWASLCALSQNQTNARTFFELFFRPVIISPRETALFTGYFEPELRGAKHRGGKYQFPLYRLPPEVKPGVQFASRAEIEDQALLAGRGLEIAWIDDAVDVFFLQVQGSGRVRLEDGSYIRVGYGGKNGHEYRSVGKEMIRRGILGEHKVSAGNIQKWVRNNPVDGKDLLQHNPSYVFFREVNQVPAHLGPLGAMNRSITAMRSIAVDPAFTPLGAPVWIEKAGRNPLRRLMIAQDTGSAIKGPQRADIFFGTGDDAGLEAGRIKDPGRMVVLLPIQRAYALAPEG